MISGIKYITKYSFLINSLICLLAIIASSLFKSTSLLAYTAFYECVGAELRLIIAYSTIYLICLIIERIKIWANNTPVIRKLFTRCTKKRGATKMSVVNPIAMIVGVNYANYTDWIPNIIYQEKVKIQFGKMLLKKTKNTLVELIVIKFYGINVVHTGSVKAMIGYNTKKEKSKNETIRD